MASSDTAGIRYCDGCGHYVDPDDPALNHGSDCRHADPENSD